MVAFLELVGLALGSASLFGLIVGLFGVYSGRATRREVSRLIAAMDGRLDKRMLGIENILRMNAEILEKIASKVGA